MVKRACTSLLGLLLLLSGCVADATGEVGDGSIQYPNAQRGLPNLLALDGRSDYSSHGEVSFSAVLPQGRSLRIEMEFVTDFRGNLRCGGSPDVSNPNCRAMPSTYPEDVPQGLDCGTVVRITDAATAGCEACYACYLENDKFWVYKNDPGGWHVNGTFYNEPPVQTYTPSQSGVLDGTLVLNSSGRGAIRYFEDGATEPSHTKAFSW